MSNSTMQVAPSYLVHVARMHHDTVLQRAPLPSNSGSRIFLVHRTQQNLLVVQENRVMPV